MDLPMVPSPAPLASVPLLHRFVAGLAGLVVAASLAHVWALTFGPSSWAVKGRVLDGAMLAGFVAGLILLAGILALAATALWRGRPWGAPGLVGWWALVAVMALAVDRATDGPGAPLAAYVVDWGLKPAALTAAVLALPILVQRLRRGRFRVNSRAHS